MATGVVIRGHFGKLKFFFYYILFYSFNIISLLLPQSFCIGGPCSFLGTESVILFRLQPLNVNVHKRPPEGYGANFYARQETDL